MSLDLLESVLSVASSYSITVYDALYVVLARTWGASFDEELKRRLEEYGVGIGESPSVRSRA